MTFQRDVFEHGLIVSSGGVQHGRLDDINYRCVIVTLMGPHDLLHSWVCDN